MLPKSKRLNLKKDFKWVASGKKIESKYAKLFIKIGDNTNPRVSIAVSSSLFKKATERNRARRLVAEAFHNTYYLLPNTINIVALPKHKVLEVKSSDVFLDLQKLLKDEKIIG
ncbi:ribonuclease P protein component [Candidatus Daviesbacteria bacterium]|nr:ribonuclease P protein component [Candidatus Daviesbacteria bacterium]